MPRLVAALLALVLLAPSCPLRAAETAASVAHFDDPDHLLPTTPPQAPAFNAKLAQLERTTGLRFFVRLLANSPTPAEDAKPGAFMRALAVRFGTDRKGLLAVYFADEDDWRLWIGDELTPRFTGKRGTVQELTDSDAIHDVKEAFLKSAQASAAAEFKRQQEARAAARQPSLPPGQHIKLQADAIVDGLIAKFPVRP
jgi:hypothetical protein